MGAALLAVGLAAAAAGSAYAKGDAARKAGNKMKDAIGRVERIDVAKEQEIAQNYDRERFKGQLALQAELDPKAAALRTEGMDALLASLSDPNETKALELVSKLADEVGTESPAIKALREKIVTDALSELELGAELPADFQAELVRTGLEAGARSGLGVAKGSGGEQASRRLLGEAGVALKQQRTENAEGALTLDSNINAARTNILTNTAAMLSNLVNSRAGKAQQAATMGYSLVPEYGLSGADAVNLDLARINQKQQLELALGSVEAQKALAKGEMIAGFIGAGGQAFSGIMGGMGGGGASGGGGSGIMGNWGAGSSIGNFEGPNRQGSAGFWDRIRGRGGRVISGG